MFLLWNEKIYILIKKESPKLVPEGPVDNKSVLVQIIAWH